jgi:hypothetical protein
VLPIEHHEGPHEHAFVIITHCEMLTLVALHVSMMCDALRVACTGHHRRRHSVTLLPSPLSKCTAEQLRL